MLNARVDRCPITRRGRWMSALALLVITLPIATFAQGTFSTFSGTVGLVLQVLATGLLPVAFILISGALVGAASGGSSILPGIHNAWMALAAMTAVIVASRRNVPPFGLEGGAPGAAGRQWVERADGTRQALSGTDSAELAPGDLALIYIGPPERAFVGRAELASAVRDWAPAEPQAYPGDTRAGVLLTDIEEWDPPVLMQTVVQRIDPTGSNPYVQANARDGFQNGLVEITEHEYEAVLAARAETSTSRT